MHSKACPAWVGLELGADQPTLFHLPVVLDPSIPADVIHIDMIVHEVRMPPQLSDSIKAGQANELAVAILKLANKSKPPRAYMVRHRQGKVWLVVSRH